jgi:hypothetical protein
MPYPQGLDARLRVKQHTEADRAKFARLTHPWGLFTDITGVI